MLSIIISWFNRKELKTALPSILSAAQYVNGDVNIINFGGDKNLLIDQVKDLRDQVNIISVNHDQGFSKAAAQNIGAKYSSHPYLFFCDCDIILTDNVLHELLSNVMNNNKSFGTLAGVRETEKNSRKANNLSVFGYELRLKIKDGSEVKIIDNEEDANNGTRQAPGLLLVKRLDFEKVAGYNSSFKGWGWEDQDMICRLTLYAKLQRINHGTALHISHDDNARMMAYKGYADRWESRDKMFRAALKNYDDNNFLGTYLQDASEFSVNKE